MLAIEVNVFAREIVTYRTNEVWACEKTGGYSCVAGRAAEQAWVFRPRGFDGIKCGSANNEETHGVVRIGAEARLSRNCWQACAMSGALRSPTPCAHVTRRYETPACASGVKGARSEPSTKAARHVPPLLPRALLEAVKVDLQVVSAPSQPLRRT